jgi:hypothetical protein
MLSKTSLATRLWRVILFQALLLCCTKREDSSSKMLIHHECWFDSIFYGSPEAEHVTSSSLPVAGHTGVLGGGATSQVADLKQLLYQEIKLAPACVRLLNATGTVGCGTAGPVSAPLLHLQDPAKDHVAGSWPPKQLASLSMLATCMITVAWDTWR